MTLRAQLLGKQDALRNKLPHTLLSALDPAAPSRNPHLTILHAKLHHVARLDPEYITYRRRNHQSSFSVDLCSHVGFRLTPPVTPIRQDPTLLLEYRPFTASKERRMPPFA